MLQWWAPSSRCAAPVVVALSCGLAAVTRSWAGLRVSGRLKVRCLVPGQAPLRRVRAKLDPLHEYAQLAPARPAMHAGLHSPASLRSGGVRPPVHAPSERTALRWYGTLGGQRSRGKHGSAAAAPASAGHAEGRRAARKRAAQEAAAALALLSLGK